MRKKNIQDDFWPSISDLMSGLMIIFMFIAISFMAKIAKEKQTIEDVAKEYQDIKISIYKDLFKEFQSNLNEWNAYIDQETLSIRFKEPEIFFRQGSSELKDEFKSILQDFFPRYIKVLNTDQYKDEIEEVRIEGHTSTEWSSSATSMESYFKNMKLSQDRTRETLEYIMSLPSMAKYEEFMISTVTANGLSYSKKIMINGTEDKQMSRRVEFRVRTKSDDKMNKMLNNEVEKDETHKL